MALCVVVAEPPVNRVTSAAEPPPGSRMEDWCGFGGRSSSPEGQRTVMHETSILQICVRLAACLCSKIKTRYEGPKVDQKLLKGIDVFQSAC